MSLLCRHGSFEPGEIQTGTKAGRKVREKDEIVGQATIPKQVNSIKIYSGKSPKADRARPSVRNVGTALLRYSLSWPTRVMKLYLLSIMTYEL